MQGFMILAIKGTDLEKDTLVFYSCEILTKSMECVCVCGGGW